MEAAAVRGAPELDEALLADSFNELAEDFDTLLVLARELASILAEAGDAGGGRAGELLGEEARLSASRAGELARRLLGLKQRADGSGPRTLFAELCGERSSARALIRTQQAVAAALATAADWQSPPFLAATAPVGCAVTPHWDDYKRDRHRQAAEYERAYVGELIDAPGEWRALLTSCGMAALTTVVALLRCDGNLARGVVAGSDLYHETKILLDAERTPVRYADEATGDLERAIRALRPGAVFVDSLCNTRWSPLPDLPRVVDACAGVGATLVIDDTSLSAASRPLALVHAAGVRAFVVESLLKYQQLGLDRTNAGIIVAGAEDAALLERLREHLGTNVADVAARALPRPRRHVLEHRLGRIGRNASLIARRLERERMHCGRIDAVVHPSLADHASYAVARPLPFRGGCVTLVLGNVSREAGFGAAAVAEARARRVELVGGSSFGFDTTRVYVAAGVPGSAEPFLRIAAGAETRIEADLVADALAAAAAAR